MAMRVMIVDDAQFMRHVIKRILTGLGCEIVAEACDGEEAIALYQQHHPDIVTLDLVMPKKGGLEALKEIRGIDPRAQVIIMSAIDQRGPLMEAMKLGAVDYLVKPFDAARVSESIKRLQPVEV